jgi:hypothetical protein
MVNCYKWNVFNAKYFLSSESFIFESSFWILICAILHNIGIVIFIRPYFFFSNAGNKEAWRNLGSVIHWRLIYRDDLTKRDRGQASTLDLTLHVKILFLLGVIGKVDRGLRKRDLWLRCLRPPLTSPSLTDRWRRRRLWLPRLPQLRLCRLPWPVVAYEMLWIVPTTLGIIKEVAGGGDDSCLRR